MASRRSRALPAPTRGNCFLSSEYVLLAMGEYPEQVVREYIGGDTSFVAGPETV
jgi:hypothetical protein